MFFLFALLFPLHACALELKFLDSVHWDPVVDFQGSKIGGLSGLSPLPLGGYIAISDDRSEFGPSRVYQLEFLLDPVTQKFQVVPRKVIPLKNGEGQFYASMALDPEGIVALPDGRMLISSEGDARPSPRIPPSVFLTSADGQWLGNLPLPEKFLPEPMGQQHRGVRNNLALESLTLAPDQENLFTLNEAPLMQDGDLSTFESGSLLRLVRWKKQGSDFALAGEFVYPLSPIPRVLEGERVGGGVGASEALALDAGSLLVLERAYVFNETEGRNSIRLFRAEVNGGAEVSTMESLVGREALAMHKELVLDFDSVLPLLPEGHHHIDNLEGMAWGPLTKEGRRTLVFVSDSNFNPSQETQFLLFEVQ